MATSTSSTSCPTPSWRNSRRTSPAPPRPSAPRWGAAKINYGAYSDKLPHLHVHLVPKYVDGPAWGTTFTMMPDPKILLSPEDYTALAAKIRAALN